MEDLKELGDGCIFDLTSCYMLTWFLFSGSNVPSSVTVRPQRKHLWTKTIWRARGTLVGVAGCQGESSHRVMDHFCPYFVKFTKRQYYVIVVGSCGRHTASFEEENWGERNLFHPYRAFYTPALAGLGTPWMSRVLRWTGATSEASAC